MSDQAIMAVTKGLRDLLMATLPAGRKVTLLPPGADPPADGSGVNLYLYRAGESPFVRNVPYPGDRAGRGPLDEPVLSLELFYLLTPFAPTPLPDDPEDESHRALGEAMTVLYGNPVLTQVHLPGFDADVALPAFLLDSFEQVKVRLHPSSLEELSRIWSTIGQPYRLSVAYEVSLVQLAPDRGVSVAPGVVQRTGVDVVAVGAPHITALDPPGGALATFAAGQVQPRRVRLGGSGFTLAGAAPTITVGGVPAEIQGAPAEREVSIALPAGLSAGPDVDVRVRVDGRASTAATFHVTPWIASLTPIRTALDRATAGDARLTIGGHGFAQAAAVRLEGPVGSLERSSFRPGSGPDTVIVSLPAAAANAAPAGKLANGVYQARVRLADGSLSNARSFEVIPRVNPVSARPTDSTYTPSSGLLTLRGGRLDGAEVRLRLDGVEHRLGANADGARLDHTFGRPPAPGSHSLTLDVDGHGSRPFTLVV